MAKRTYHGSCHCKAVTFEADLDLDAGTGRCNCSFCAKVRNWSVNVKPDAFRLLTGADALADYTKSEYGHHRFCRTCGVHTHGHGHIPQMGGDYVSVKVSALDDLTPEELAGLKVQYMNGRDNAWWDAPPVTKYL